MNGFEKMCAMCEEAYIKVYGKEKWWSLTDAQKREAILTMCKTLDKAISK
jgi:hypothetical protein